MHAIFQISIFEILNVTIKSVFVNPVTNYSIRHKNLVAICPAIGNLCDFPKKKMSY